MCLNTSQVVKKCSYVSQEPPQILVHGALKEAEILTSLLPNVFAQLGLVFGCWLPGTNCLVLNTKMYFLNLAWIMGTSTQLMGVSTPPKGLQMFLCFSGTYKPNLVHGTLMEAEILTSLPPNVFVQLGLVSGHQHSCPQVCQHLPSSLEMFLCVSGTS